jgi:hypothetical protein
MPDVTHADLVRIACRWLRKAKRCPIVFAEAGKNVTVEEPDALGFRSALSHVIECKVSRADFLADGKKPHRQLAGMGRFRWFLTPPDLVAPTEVPEGWGLLYAHGKRVHEIVKAPFRPERDTDAELMWLYCVARRHQLGVAWLPAEYRFETIDEGDERKRAERALEVGDG